VSENAHDLRTIIRRPQDCSEKTIKTFIEMVAAGGEADAHRVEHSLPYTDALIISMIGNTIVGVSALLRPRTSYLKHLFECAGEPRMCNPYSLESCWLSVPPEHRGKGIWQHNNAAKRVYIGNRPYHSVRRVENKNVADLSKENVYEHVGKDFYSPISKDKLRLMAANHDLVFDPKKTFVYM